VLLTIEPGVVVKFAPGTNLAIDGCLIAVGNSTDMITFTSNATAPAPGDWGSIWFRSSGIGDIAYSRIEYAATGINFENYDNPAIDVTNSVFIANNDGMDVQTEPNLIGLTIENNTDSGILADGGSFSLSDSSILNNDFGIWGSGFFGIDNCTISYNTDDGIGYALTAGISISDLLNSNITNNGGWGIFLQYYGLDDCYNTTISDNLEGGLNCGWANLYNVNITNNTGYGISSNGTIGGSPISLVGCSVSSNTLGGLSVLGVDIENSSIMDNANVGVSTSGGNIHFCNLTNKGSDEVTTTGGNVNATYNWWGTANETLIRQRIYDYYDDPSLGQVSYVPFLNSSGPWSAPKGPTITVPDDYPTIQEAVNAASAGDTIFVKDGTYHEHVTLDQTLTLIGESRKTIVDGNGVGDIFGVEYGGSNSIISGFTLQNADCGILMLIQRGPTPVVNNVNISDNTIQNCNEGIDTYSGDAIGDVSFNMMGINLQLTGDISCNIIGNLFLNNTIGINNSYGVNSIVIRNNFILFSTEGIDFQSSAQSCDCNSTNNRIFGNEYGIFFSGYNDYSVRMFSDNILDRNEYAAYIDYAASVQSDTWLFYHNNFVNNTQGVFLATPNLNMTWDDGYPSGGNYWSGYNGTDEFSGPFQNESGSDGIGDTPYLINENNRDNYPFMQPLPISIPNPTSIPLNPIPQFSYSPNTPIVNEIISFNALSSIDLNGTIVRYAWNFGDGTNSTQPLASHAYSSAGTYNVTLTVTDNYGLTNFNMKAVSVGKPSSIAHASSRSAWEFWTLVTAGIASIAVATIAIYLAAKRYKHKKRIEERSHLDTYLAANILRARFLRALGGRKD
jgi:PKD repeat protein